jgi:hypothetical protein
MAATSYSQVANGGKYKNGALFLIRERDIILAYVQPIKTEARCDMLFCTYGSGLTTITNNSPFHPNILNEIFPGFKKQVAVVGYLLLILARSCSSLVRYPISIIIV